MRTPHADLEVHVGDAVHDNVDKGHGGDDEPDVRRLGQPGVGGKAEQRAKAASLFCRLPAPGPEGKRGRFMLPTMRRGRADLFEGVKGGEHAGVAVGHEAHGAKQLEDEDVRADAAACTNDKDGGSAAVQQGMYAERVA